MCRASCSMQVAWKRVHGACVRMQHASVFFRHSVWLKSWGSTRTTFKTMICSKVQWHARDGTSFTRCAQVASMYSAVLLQANVWHAKVLGNHVNSHGPQRRLGVCKSRTVRAGLWLQPAALHQAF